jgi:plasmid stabilization system protein ParE
VNYWLHPWAEEDLRDAAEFYRNRAGNSLSQSLLSDFEQSVNILLRHPHLGSLWRNDKRRYLMKHFPTRLSTQFPAIKFASGRLLTKIDGPITGARENKFSLGARPLR